MAAAGQSPKRARKPNVLTKGQAALLARIVKAGGIFRTRAAEVGVGGDTWYFVNDHGRPHPATVRRLISKGRLVPTGDSLFGIGDSQSFVPKL